MANVNVRAQIDKLNRGEPLTRPVVMEPAKIKEPKVRAEPIFQVPGPGSISVDQDHMWAFFDSSYTAVNLTSARVEFNPSRDSPDKMWMGIVFDEQMVYKLGSEQKRTKFRRATQRDPILQSYEGGFGNLGAVLTGLKGHMTLSYQIPRNLGTDPEFYKEVSDVFMKFLRSQHDNDNPEHLPWINRLPLGQSRGHSGGVPCGLLLR